MFTYDVAVTDRYPALRAGLIHATGLANGLSSPALLDGYRTEQRAAARAVLADYEAEHGEITEAELARVRAQWPA